MSLKIIDTKKDLQEFAARFELRPDWHEPDEQDVTAVVKGRTFDNAGFWPEERAIPAITEKHVILKVEGEAVAAVNLATLFALACGTVD